ncbi:MAG: signal peptidase I [Acidobacteria bacterium]|nr:signal peptidase I [Acidobacteriota bacterium]
MVQPELHPEDAGRERDGDPREPRADQAVADAPEPVGDEYPEAIEPGPAWDRRRAVLLRRAGEELVAWVKTLASAAVYATLIVTFGFQVARVEGRSMEPTLQDQDRLIVNKAAYRFFGEPQVGDIVMLDYPRDPDKSFVKRIVAEAGDTVRIENGRVFVNEVLQPDLYVPPEFRSYENHGPEVVQEAYYFVMGDHRNNSSDSRHWGQVPRGYIIGRVQLRWWPLTEVRTF